MAARGHGKVTAITRHGHIGFRVCPRRIPIPIDERMSSQISAVSRRKLTSCIDKVINTIPNDSPAQYRNLHHVSQASAFTSSSFPTRHRSPILMASQFERSPTAEDYALFPTGEELTRLRTYLRNFPQRLLTDQMRCRPGDINRRAP